MSNQFLEKPLFNSPFSYPARHWELDEQGQPTQQLAESVLVRVVRTAQTKRRFVDIELAD